MLGRLFGWSPREEPFTVFEPKHFTRQEEVNTFVMSYYREPKPELVWQLLDFLGTGDDLRCKGGPGLVGFLAEFLATHPERVRGLSRLARSKSRLLENVFRDGRRLSRFGERALILRIDTVHFHNRFWCALHLEPFSPPLNDLFWGAYYASGDTRYLDRLIEHMRLVEEQQDPIIFLAGATARWSLGCHACSDPMVCRYLESVKSNHELGTRNHIELVLSVDPRGFVEHMQRTFEERGWGQSPQGMA
jgi:hypothetical protein